MPQISIDIRPWVHRPSLLRGSALILGTVAAAVALAPTEVRGPSVPLLGEFLFQWLLVPPMLYVAGMARRNAAPFQWTLAPALWAIITPWQFAGHLVALPPGIGTAVSVGHLIGAVVISTLALWGLVLFRKRESETARARLAQRRADLDDAVSQAIR